MGSSQVSRSTYAHPSPHKTDINISVYSPPGPEPSWYRPSHSENHPHTYGSSSTSSPSAYSSSSPTATAQNAACASVSALAASRNAVSPSATPTVPAQLAYECLNSIPFNRSAAVALIDSIDPYLNWQTTLEYLPDPPAEVRNLFLVLGVAVADRDI